MAVDLAEMVKGYLRPEILQKAASFVGESESGTKKAMNAIVPTLLAAIANLASTSSGAEKLSQTLDAGRYDGSSLKNLGGLFGGGETTQKAIIQGKDFLSSLLGNKSDGLIDQITRLAGIRTSSTSSLTALAVSLILNVLGSRRATVGQSPSALASLLGEQKGFLSSLLPAGIASFMGWTGYEGIRPREAVAGIESRRETRSWLIPVVVLGGILLAVLGWLLNQRSPIPDATVAARAVAKPTDLQLPGGLKVSVPEGSINHSLHQWLADTSDTTMPKRFVFDNLNFETGSTELTADSAPTVDSLVTIMKAYPSVVVRLEGYTDNTGDVAANKKLSLDRAVTVKESMVQGGIAATRIDADGYGEERPIASNETDEGRAKNRRTELVVEKR
jgi:OOP family OmpA-OmpF porin